VAIVLRCLKVMDDESQSRDTLLRLTVPEAASHLGVTQSAIRKRVQRKQIPFDKDERGYTYVYISHDESRSRDRDPSHVTETDVTGPIPDESHNGPMDELKYRVESLERQVRFLQDELISRRVETERKDAILIHLSKALPEPRGEPLSISEGTEAPPEGKKPIPWWRRLFGT